MTIFSSFITTSSSICYRKYLFPVLSLHCYKDYYNPSSYLRPSSYTFYIRVHYFIYHSPSLITTTSQTTNLSTIPTTLYPSSIPTTLQTSMHISRLSLSSRMTVNFFHLKLGEGVTLHRPVYPLYPPPLFLLFSGFLSLVSFLPILSRRPLSIYIVLSYFLIHEVHFAEKIS